MSAALSVLESFASNTGIDHSKEMNVIHAIVAECEKGSRSCTRFTTSLMATNVTGISV
jgi:hypothetical protein